MTFVVGGNLVPTASHFPRYQTYMPPMSVPLGAWRAASYAEMFKRHLWVSVVVSKRAKATARLPLPVYRRAEGGRVRDRNHAMARLLRNPNPMMDGFDLWLWTSSTFDLQGIAWWYKLRTPQGRVAALLPMHPSNLTYNEDDGTHTFSNGRLLLERIPDRDLVCFRSFNPDDAMRGGMSPLEPLRATLENEWAARAATSSFWTRGARPSMALRHPKNLSDPAQKRLRDQLEANHVGAKNAGSVLILEEDMSVEKFELTAEESQYIETRKLNREEVCAAFDVPPPVVHILDRATFSNITEQMRSMYRDTMAPHLSGFEAAVERQLRAVEWPEDDVYAEFLLDEVLRGDFEQRQAAYSKATHMTLAEKREMENLPFIEGTDRIFLNTATMPLNLIDARVQAVLDIAAARQALPPGSTDGLTTLSAVELRTVMGRLSGARVVAELDESRLVEGLDAEQRDAVVELAAEHFTDPHLDDFKDALRALAKEDA